MALERKLHCTHCEQTFSTTDMDRCSLCGKSGGMVSPEVATEMAQQRQLERNVQARQAAATPTRMLLAYHSIRWWIGGIVCLGLGIWLVFDPRLRNDPRQLRFSDLMPGLGAIVGGLVICSLAYLTWPRTRNAIGTTPTSSAIPTDRKAEP
jgi:hypothetical protein